MVATAFLHPVGIIQLHGSVSDAGSAIKYGHSSFRFISKNFAVDVGLLNKGQCSYREGQLHVVHALSSQAQATDPISSTSHGIPNNSRKTSNVFILL